MRPILITCLFVLLCVQCGSGQGDAGRKFDPHQVVRPFPAITDAKVSKPSAATNKVGDNDLVIGLVIGGEARAYPINMLTGPQREIINDRLGGRSIAATW